MFRVSALLRLALALSASAPAIAQPASPARPTGPVYHFSVASTVPVPDEVRYHDGQKVVPMVVPVRSRSSPQVLTGTNLLHLGHEVLGADGLTATTRPLAKLALPPGGGRYLVILSPSEPGSSEPFRAIAFEDGYETFPARSVRLKNLSPRPLHVRIGGTQATVAAADTVLLRPEPAPKGRLLPFWVAARSFDGTRDQRLLASGLELSTSARLLVFVAPHPEFPEQVVTMVLRDQVPVAQAKKPGAS